MQMTQEPPPPTHPLQQPPTPASQQPVAPIKNRPPPLQVPTQRGPGGNAAVAAIAAATAAALSPGGHSVQPVPSPHNVQSPRESVEKGALTPGPGKPVKPVPVSPQQNA